MTECFTKQFHMGPLGTWMRLFILGVLGSAGSFFEGIISKSVKCTLFNMRCEKQAVYIHMHLCLLNKAVSKKK